MRAILSIILLLLTWGAHADESFPSGCKAFRVQEEPLLLSAPKPLLVMIHNLSNTELWITHPESEPSASAGWSSRVQAGHWSALVLREKSFELSCIESKPGHEQKVPCAGVLAVCQWTDLTMPGEGNETYWAGEDMTLPDLKGHLEREGFILPTASQ